MPTATYDSKVVASSARANLVAWWKLSATPVRDMQGHIFNATAHNVTFTTAGLPDDGDAGAHFDGISAFISIEDDEKLHLSQGAIHFAVDIDAFPDAGNFAHFLSKEGDGMTEQDFVVGLFNNSGTPELRAQFVLSGGVQRVIHTGVTSGKHWVTLNFGGNRGLELLVDAVLRDTNVSYTAGMNANTRPLLMGAADLGDGATQFFAGRIKHVQFYDRRLTAQEISNLSPAIASTIASPGRTPIWQSDETDPHHTVGQTQSEGAFARWGIARIVQKGGNAVAATSYSIELDPADGQRAYRATIPAGHGGAGELLYDFVGAGKELSDVDFEWEIYIPKAISVPDKLHFYSMQMHGHDWKDTTAGRWVVDGPSVVLSFVYDTAVHPDLLVPELYSYTANKPGRFGSWLKKVATRPSIAVSFDRWTGIRMEMRGGMGGWTWNKMKRGRPFPDKPGKPDIDVPDVDAGGDGDTSGTLKFFINDKLSSGASGIAWHQTKGLGWRHVGCLWFLHKRKAPSEQSIYFRNVRIYNRG